MQRLSIIGRDLQIIDELASRIQKVLRMEHDYTNLGDTADMRGRSFEVRLENGRVARVTVELDRVEFPTESVGFLAEESHRVGEQ